ncbi:hypothetical protein PC129_g4956 [Phytophthora cactorum]|uniref:Uncharacterized protein n=1 Tax=Phytophthora cactorum TaxID=29920 RepID=A0A8T1GLQ8_9STRA|nr:hypothetical protein PC111_g5631 [Phytophthora cactorum]KAG2846901.1 hypothetical protein PC112_g1295 [Phytophthora cactorum]KAG2943277.1 hypothetical protein PC115_g976 [Phytophthora cactorum]KAG2947403.1 hypothetical protein PC117_g6830 [Phytophthora cactorum]KAG2999495.1 hypothetical protein PC118_g802 [Phytophthora cactorum]
MSSRPYRADTSGTESCSNHTSFSSSFFDLPSLAFEFTRPQLQQEQTLPIAAVLAIPDGYATTRTLCQFRFH